MRYHHGGSICFEIKHNQIQFSLKVLNHSEIVFEVSSMKFFLRYPVCKMSEIEGIPNSELDVRESPLDS